MNVVLMLPINVHVCVRERGGAKTQKEGERERDKGEDYLDCKINIMRYVL